MEEISLCEANSRHLHLWKSLYQMLRYNKMKAGFHFGGTKPAAAFKRASGWRRTRSRRTAGDCCKVPCFGSFYVLLLDRERTRFLKKQVRYPVLDDIWYKYGWYIRYIIIRFLSWHNCKRYIINTTLFSKVDKILG